LGFGLVEAPPNGLSSVNPKLREILYYDAEFPGRPSLRERAIRGYYAAVGAPGGIVAQLAPRPTFVMAKHPLPDDLDEIYAAPRLFYRAHHHFLRYHALARVKVEARPDIFHATHVTPLRVAGCANIVTIHDLVPLRLPYSTLDDKTMMFNLLTKLCKEADHIVTVSEFSRRDIISMFGVSEDRITNTYQSVSYPDSYKDADEEAVNAEIGPSFQLEWKEYFLFLGAIEPKKNIKLLIEAYAASGVQTPLILVGGPGWLCDEELEMIHSERFLSYRVIGSRIIPERRVRRLPYVHPRTLAALIRGAKAVLFPSLYEGFGLPVVEAMALGTAVMTSNAACLPEVAGGAALLVDPSDRDSIKRGILALDSDSDLRADLVSRGRVRAQFFSQANYAERVSSVYAQVL
jgi:glycosyltransferase involved in cell wall biosynthesis